MIGASGERNYSYSYSTSTLRSSYSASNGFTLGLLDLGTWASLVSQDDTYLELVFGLDFSSENLGSSFGLNLVAGNANQINAVPLPSTIWLFMSALPFLIRIRKK